MTTKEIVRVLNKIRIRGIKHSLRLEVEDLSKSEQEIENVIMSNLIFDKEVSRCLLEFFIDGVLFSDHKNQCLYNALIHLYACSKEFTKTNIVNQLTTDKQLSKTEGELYINSLMNKPLSEEAQFFLPRFLCGPLIVYEGAIDKTMQSPEEQ